MQSDTHRYRRSLPKIEKASAKRTTIILDKNDRRYIDALIAEGKEEGIKQLIAKMLEIYRKMMIYDWRFPGEYYCGVSRVAFVNVELINILLQQIPKEKWRSLGRRMGEALKISMETTLEMPKISREHWDEVFERLRVQGFGVLQLKDKYLLAKLPFINEGELLGGMLEGLLDVDLDVKNSVPPLVFEIK